MYQQFDFSVLRIIIVLVGTLLFFYVYYYTAHSEFLKNKILGDVRNSVQIKLFLSKKLLGFLFMGIVPGIIYLLNTNMDYLQFFKGSFISILPVLSILIAIISITVFINQKLNKKRNSLHMNITEWNFVLFGINAFGWIIYLCAYEFLFRGILLFECYNSFGFWPAIAINVVLYSAIHMVNGKDEALGALVFGAVACYFTLTKETLLIPVVMHVSLSLFSDFFTIRLNPEIRFKTDSKLLMK